MAKNKHSHPGRPTRTLIQVWNSFLQQWRDVRSVPFGTYDYLVDRIRSGDKGDWSKVEPYRLLTLTADGKRLNKFGVDVQTDD